MEIRPRLILVPTDFSEPAAHALRFASRLAERFGAKVRLLYADYFVPPVDFSASAAVEYALSSDEAADEAKKQLIRVAEEYLPKSVDFDTRVVIDSPIPAIVDEARSCGADLLVMGTHGRTGFRRLIVGSVTESVMRIVNVPVIAISPITDDRRMTATLPRIVCAVDYSDESREALRYAASIADPTSRVIVVSNLDTDNAQDAADEIVRMQRWTPPELVERCQYKLLPADHAAEQVVEFAKLVFADVIAVGSAHDRRTSEVVRGTLAERIAERADCPVLVVNDIAAMRLAPHPAFGHPLPAARGEG
jgi:nucleotide-binding universal stress UspA family protein